jgi:hypothetical protein
LELVLKLNSGWAYCKASYDVGFDMLSNSIV